MSIKSRIHLALGIVLMLHVFTVVMGHIGLQKAQNDFTVYEGMNADTLRVLAIDKSVAELQRSVATYMLSGHESAADRVRELLGEINSQITESIEETDQNTIDELFAQMSVRIGSFGVGFEKVVSDRAMRSTLVYEDMFPTRVKIIEHVDQLEEPGVGWAILLKDHLYRAENAALLYLDKPDRASVDQVLLQLSEAKEQVDASRGINPDASGLIEEIDQYEQAFLQVVRSTQGYMHLVNVVLAGEASELLYESSEIRSVSLAQRQARQSSMQSGAKRFQTISDLVGMVTVLAGIITASLMTRSVVGPILSITGTLNRLSNGQPEEEIQFTGRSDEIGSMANAAEVFRLKNHETEELLHKTQSITDDLERKNTEMAEFVYTVSHDLKSPLVTIQGFAGALSSTIEQGETDEVMGMVDRITNACTRMSRTVEDLLEHSRVGIQGMQTTEVRFADVFDIVESDLAGSIAKSNAQITLSGGDLTMTGDELRVRQVLQNLIQNAITHGASEDGVPRIEVGLERMDDEMVIAVRDHGAGIDARFQEQVFGLFKRLSNKTPGTGVGLAIVRKIADGHGGRAWVDAGVESGARICVSFPCRVAAGAEQSVA